jgi:hypothetical protein
MAVFAAAPPSLLHVERFVRRARGNMFGGPLPDEEPDTKRSRHEGSGLLPPPPLPEIGQSEAEASLRRGVIRLCAHVGYHTAQVWAAVLGCRGDNLVRNRISRSESLTNKSDSFLT